MPEETAVSGITLEEADYSKTSRRGVTFQEAGQGRPVLLLHAFPLSSAMWRPQIQSLRADWHVIAPDLRGFGSTPGFIGAPSVEQMADDAAALLDELNVAEPVVGGLAVGWVRARSPPPAGTRPGCGRWSSPTRGPRPTTPRARPTATR